MIYIYIQGREQPSIAEPTHAGSTGFVAWGDSFRPSADLQPRLHLSSQKYLTIELSRRQEVPRETWPQNGLDSPQDLGWSDPLKPALKLPSDAFHSKNVPSEKQHCVSKKSVLCDVLSPNDGTIKSHPKDNQCYHLPSCLVRATTQTADSILKQQSSNNEETETQQMQYNSKKPKRCLSPLTSRIFLR